MPCLDCHYSDPSDHESVTTGVCSQCGGQYRDQPNPIHSEMEMRNMPAPGEEDQGGNPLREGILADNGWQNGGTDHGTGRDESYASVNRQASFPEGTQFPICRMCKQRAGYEVYPFANQMLQCKNCGDIEGISTLADRLNSEKLDHDTDIAGLPEVEHPLGPQTGSYQDNIVERQDAHIPWHMAADFEIEQVVEPGPHTVEVDAPGQPIILQHEDPAVLDNAKGQLEKSAGLLKSLFQTGGMIAGGALGTAIGPEGTAAGAILGRAAGGLVGGAIGGGAENALQGAGGGGAAAAPAAPIYPRSLEQLSKIVEGDSGDFSQEHIPANDTEDPEEVDPHEKNDGDNQDWEKDFSVNGVGGAQSPFGEDSGALEALELLLPLVIHHHQNGGTGASDPLIRVLDEMLEGEAPGYKDNHDDEAVQIILGLGKPKDPSADKSEEGAPVVKDEAGDIGDEDDLDSNDIEKESAYPGTVPGAVHPEEEALQSQNWPEALPTHCPGCNNFVKPSLGGCPMCGAEIIPYDERHRTASGPRTPEQFKAVADLLRSTQREDELQNLIDNPDQYEKELAEVQQRQEVTPADGPEQPPQPPMPTMEETPPDAGMPMPAPPTGIQQMGAVVEAADNIAAKCPKCDSHTTGIASEEGDRAKCQTCGHEWDQPDTQMEVVGSWHVTAEEDGGDHNDHDHSAAPDLEQSQDTGGSLTWTDESGEPLKVGQSYKMYSPNYEIPDDITVTAIKPHAISVELQGEYGIDHGAEITQDDLSLYQYSFVPSDGQDAPVNDVNDVAPEQADYPADAEGAGQQTDLSDSSAYRQSSEDHNDPALEWLRPTAGAQFTMMEQREFIDERGEARNKDKLDLSRTHYDSGYRSAEDDDFLWGL